MTNYITYERTESLTGYRNVKIGIRVDCEPGTTADIALIAAKAFVHSELDKELERAGEPARYDHTSPRGMVIALRGVAANGVEIEFIVPCRTYIPGFMEYDAGHRVSYLKEKYPCAHMRVTVARPAYSILSFLDSCGIVAVTDYHNDFKRMISILTPVQVPENFPYFLTWYENAEKAQAAIDTYENAHVVDAATALAEIKKQVAESEAIPF